MKAILHFPNHAPITVEDVQSVKGLSRTHMEELQIDTFILTDVPYLFIGKTTIAINGNKLEYVTFIE